MVFPRLSTSAFVPRGVNTLVVLTVVRHLPSIATPCSRNRPTTPRPALASSSFSFSCDHRPWLLMAPRCGIRNAGGRLGASRGLDCCSGLGQKNEGGSGTGGANAGRGLAVESSSSTSQCLVLDLLLVLTFLVGRIPWEAVPRAVDARAQQVATIASDRTDYSPGDTVTLTGGGWTPQETVTIVLHRQPLVHPDTVLTAVADANGTITNTSFAPALDDFGVTFFVTATGSQSGLQAIDHLRGQGEKDSWTGAVSTDWNTAGNWNSAERAHRQRRRHDSGRRPKRPLSRHQLDRVRHVT